MQDSAKMMMTHGRGIPSELTKGYQKAVHKHFHLRTKAHNSLLFLAG